MKLEIFPFFLTLSLATIGFGVLGCGKKEDVGFLLNAKNDAALVDYVHTEKGYPNNKIVHVPVYAIGRDIGQLDSMNGIDSVKLNFLDSLEQHEYWWWTGKIDNRYAIITEAFYKTTNSWNTVTPKEDFPRYASLLTEYRFLQSSPLDSLIVKGFDTLSLEKNGQIGVYHSKEVGDNLKLFRKLKLDLRYDSTFRSDMNSAISEWGLDTDILGIPHQLAKIDTLGEFAQKKWWWAIEKTRDGKVNRIYITN